MIQAKNIASREDNFSPDEFKEKVNNFKNFNEKCVENAKEKVKALEKEKADIEKIMQEKKLKKEN